MAPCPVAATSPDSPTYVQDRTVQQAPVLNTPAENEANDDVHCVRNSMRKVDIAEAVSLPSLLAMVGLLVGQSRNDVFSPINIMSQWVEVEASMLKALGSELPILFGRVTDLEKGGADKYRRGLLQLRCVGSRWTCLCGAGSKWIPCCHYGLQGMHGGWRLRLPAGRGRHVASQCCISEGGDRPAPRIIGVAGVVRLPCERCRLCLHPGGYVQHRPVLQ